MGIPAGPAVVDGLADPEDVDRMSGEPDRSMRWEAGTDTSVGQLVADRFGPSVVARSVDNRIVGVDAATGQKKWTVQRAAPPLRRCGSRDACPIWSTPPTA